MRKLRRYDEMKSAIAAVQEMSLTQGKINVTLPDGCRWIVKFNPKYPLLKDKYAIIGERNLTKAIEIANKKYFTFWENLSSYSAAGLPKSYFV